MTVYAYTAKTADGERVHARIDAETLQRAALKLQASGLFPVAIEPYAGEKKGFAFLRFRRSRIPRQEILRFTVRLVDLLKGGLPLARALGVLERQTENAALKKVSADLRGAVQEGKSLSASMNGYPELFPKMYTSMVRAGEAAGLLESVLARLAEFGEKEEELKYKVRAALAYPAVMLAAGGASVIFIMAFVMPKFELMFREMGQMLPLPTRILIAMSAVVKQGWWVYVPVLAGGFLAVKKQLKTEAGRKKCDRLLLSLPVLGDLLLKEQVARCIRTLSALLRNGVPLLDALQMAEEAANTLLAAEIRTVRREVQEGNGLVEPLRKSSVFPPMVAEMAAIGEETGGLEGALERTAAAYEREVDRAVKMLTSLLEPLVILAVGVLVGFVAISMLMPVFQISTIVR